jgi:hypothetical protein
MNRLLPAPSRLARTRAILTTLPHGLPTAMTFALGVGVAALSSAILLHATLLSAPRRLAADIPSGGAGNSARAIVLGSPAEDAPRLARSTGDSETVAFHASPAPASHAPLHAASRSTGSGAGMTGPTGGAAWTPDPGPTAEASVLQALPPAIVAPAPTPTPAADPAFAPAPTPTPAADPAFAPAPTPTPTDRHQGSGWSPTSSPRSWPMPTVTPTPTPTPTSMPTPSRTHPPETPEPSQTPEPTQP